MRSASVSFAIQTHPARLAQARDLRARLAPFDARLAVDPEPDGPRTANRSARLAFAAASTEHTHHVVLQDDVSIADGFADAARWAARLYPDAVVSFFVNWSAANSTLARWAALTRAAAVPVIETYVPTQAVLLPGQLSLAFADYLGADDFRGWEDDNALLRFAREVGAPTLILVPNLVEHTDAASLVGNGWKGSRRSVCVLPEPMVNERTRVLDVPAMVPFVEMAHNAAVTLDVHPYGDGDRRDTVSVLGDWGAGEDELWDASRAALADLPAAQPILDRIDEKHRFLVWVTAAAMGAIQATLWPGSAAALPYRLADPVFARALRTLAPGALRRVVDPEFLIAHADYLAVLAVHGMAYGAEVIRPDFADIRPARSDFYRPDAAGLAPAPAAI
jgi:hypothetical protein